MVRELRVLAAPQRAGGEGRFSRRGADVAAHDALRAAAGVPHYVALVRAGLGENANLLRGMPAGKGECHWSGQMLGQVLFISKIVTLSLPNTFLSLSSARISRRFSGFCRLWALM